VKPRNRDAREAKLGVGTFDGRSWRRIQRRMKGENAEGAEAVIDRDLRLRIELPGRVTLVKMAKGKELSGQNQDAAKARNRLYAAPN
jgi:hypothetical protein